MNRKYLKSKGFDKLLEIASADSRLMEVLDFVKETAGQAELGEKKQHDNRLRMPYVSPPTLTERSWK